MLRALGAKTVASAGTPVAVLTDTVGLDAYRQGLLPTIASSVFAQALPGNTGYVYIGLKGMNKTTKAGVLAIIAVPTGTDPACTALPAVNIASPGGAPNMVNPNDLYIDADQNDDGALISIIVH